jgi:hypothetical protein
MARTTSYTAEAVIKAIQGTAGVKSKIAERLDVSRQTVDNYLDRWTTVKEAYETEKAHVDDAALSVVIRDIIDNGDVSTAKWWLSKKLPEFNDKVDITSGGQVIKVTLSGDD